MKTMGTKWLMIFLALCLLATLCACSAEGDDADDAYYISYKGAKICPGAEAGNLLETLGEPNTEKNNGNCGGQGVQMKYSYDSFDLYLLESTDGKVTVDQISLKDDLVETPKGIAIGSAKGDVLDTYGEPTTTTGKTLIYQKGKQELVFKLNGDAVSAIDIIHVTQ